jgi:hypothetical protein
MLAKKVYNFFLHSETYHTCQSLLRHGDTKLWGGTHDAIGVT